MREVRKCYKLNNCAERRTWLANSPKQQPVILKSQTSLFLKAPLILELNGTFSECRRDYYYAIYVTLKMLQLLASSFHSGSSFTAELAGRRNLQANFKLVIVA